MRPSSWADPNEGRAPARLESRPLGPLFLCFLAGAAAGAVVVAFTTPKSGPDLRSDLKALARRAGRKAGELVEEAGGTWTDLRECAALVAEDQREGQPPSSDEL